MKTNERPFDRTVRAIGGAILLAIVIFSLAGPVALIEGVIVLITGTTGAFLLLTGLIGWCPAYALLGLLHEIPDERSTTQ